MIQLEARHEYHMNGTKKFHSKNQTVEITRQDLQKKGLNPYKTSENNMTAIAEKIAERIKEKMTPREYMEYLSDKIKGKKGNKTLEKTMYEEALSAGMKKTDEMTEEEKTEQEQRRKEYKERENAYRNGVTDGARLLMYYIKNFKAVETDYNGKKAIVPEVIVKAKWYSQKAYILEKFMTMAWQHDILAKFYYELDEENQEAMTDWIERNYKGTERKGFSDGF